MKREMVKNMRWAIYEAVKLYLKLVINMGAPSTNHRN